MSSETKKCTKCGGVMGIVEFTKHKRRKDGYESMCKLCLKKYRADRRKNNPDSASRDVARARKWERDNADKLRHTRGVYIERNREHIRDVAREWRSSNAVHVSDYMKSYRQSNKEELKDWSKRYYEKNKRKVLSEKHVKRAALDDTYITNVMGMRKHEAIPELITIKREQLQYYRLAKEFKRTVKEVFK